MKISIFKPVTLTLIFCLGLSPLQANTPEPPRNASHQQIHQAISVNPQNIQTFLTLSFLALAANKDGKSFKDQLNPKTFIKNFIETYGTTFFVTLSHELGHACVAKILDGIPLNVHIGNRSNAEPLAKIGPVTIENLNPLCGYAKTTKPVTSKLKASAILAAGPLSGVFGYYLLKSMKNFCKDYSMNNSQSLTSTIKSSIQKAFTNPNGLDAIALWNLLYLFIPFGKTGDSSRLYKILGVDPELVDSMGTFGPQVVFLLPALFALNQMTKS